MPEIGFGPTSLAGTAYPVMVQVPKLPRPDARGVFVDEQRSFAAFVNEVGKCLGS